MPGAKIPEDMGSLGSEFSTWKNRMFMGKFWGGKGGNHIVNEGENRRW